MSNSKIVKRNIYILLVAVQTCFFAACAKNNNMEDISLVSKSTVFFDETLEENVLKENNLKDIYEFEPGDSFELIWSDEFEGDSLDTTKWSYQLGDGSDYVSAGWGNGESQIYTDNVKNVSVSEGTLKITALKEKLQNGATGFTSGRIRTITDDNEVLFSTVFGRIEAKIKIEGGSGIWPAFWLLPVNDSIYGKWAASGEIDVMEVRGRVPNKSTGTAHFGRSWPNNTYKGDEYAFKEGTDVTDYHVYAVEWDPDAIRWYIDDECFFALTDWFSKKAGNPADFTYPAPFDVPFYILLNVAVGGNFDPDAIIKDESFPGIMTVDYVRVYQRTQGYEEAVKTANAKGKEVSDDLKTPLASGNCVYNGSFDLGQNHTAFWKTDDLKIKVDSLDFTRKLTVLADNEGIPRLYQTGLYIEEGCTYGIRVDTFAKEETEIIIRLYDDSQNIIVEETVSVMSADNKINAFKIENTVTCDNVTFEIEFLNGAILSIDNVMLMKLS